jgi:hypothetical protein
MMVVNEKREHNRGHQIITREFSVKLEPYEYIFNQDFDDKWHTLCLALLRDGVIVFYWDKQVQQESETLYTYKNFIDTTITDLLEPYVDLA